MNLQPLVPKTNRSALAYRAMSSHGGIRTHIYLILSQAPLPVGVRGHLSGASERRPHQFHMLANYKRKRLGSNQQPMFQGICLAGRRSEPIATSLPKFQLLLNLQFAPIKKPCFWQGFSLNITPISRQSPNTTVQKRQTIQQA